jgi:hypothetical protein
MTIRARTLLLALAALLAALVITGCGGGDSGSSASEDTSVDELLDKTFSGKKNVDSGKLDLSLKLDVQGGSSSQVQGPISLRLSGPFQTQGKGKLPKFDIDASFEGAGQNLKAGLASTGDKGFVNFQGTEYAVSDQVFQQFRAGYEQAQKQATEGSKDQQSLATLGIDPRRWLTDAQNAGEAKVGDTDTIKITGGVDVSKLLDDVNTALEKARGLGVQGSGSLPEKLTDEQKRQAAEAIKNLKVEIYTGKEDTTLRRMLVSMDVQAAEASSGGAQSGSLALDFSLLDLNEGQDIAEPSGAKPFDELLGQLGGLGLGAGAPGSGSGSGSGSDSSGSGASAKALKEYSDCIEAAGEDVAKAQKCAELLSP